jgi:hypothetical protein
MKEATRAIRLAIMLALAVCALGVAASSALAVSIEPLSTKFSGTAAPETEPLFEFNAEGLEVRCKGATLSGTTNPTKTNFINATDGFSGCKTVTGTIVRTVTFSNSCAKEGTIPWTVTLNEGSGKGTDSLTLNCALVASFVGTSCTVTAPAQTVTSGGSWLNVKAVNLELKSKNMVLTASQSEHCVLVTGNVSELLVTDSVLINGIHAA